MAVVAINDSRAAIQPRQPIQIYFLSGHD